MSLEIELKFPVTTFASVQAALARRGVSFGPAVRQVDQYFAHPLRDFSETDEALRLRVLPDSCRLTYKGPKLDRVSKTRREIEFPVDLADAHEATLLLQALGFRQVAVVTKHRRNATAEWDTLSVRVALDTVNQVGRFVELEVVTTTEPYEPIRQELFHFAASLDLVHSERRSYLELLQLHDAEGHAESE